MKTVLPSGIDEVMQKLMTCKNFQTYPYFTERDKQVGKRKEAKKE